MSEPIKIDSTLVYDEKRGNKEVFPGCKIRVIPAETRMKLGLSDQIILARDRVEFLERLLRETDLTIDWIGRWPSGKDMLYFRTKNGGGTGCHAEEFMAV